MLLVQNSGNSQPLKVPHSKLQLGVVWKDMFGFYGSPAQEIQWGEKGRLLFFYRDGTELQVYLDEKGEVESFLTLYHDGVILSKDKALLKRLAATDGVFVKVVDEKNKKTVKFQGMAYISTDKVTKITSFLLTGPKHGYQHLYAEATYRESDLRRFNRQIFEQIRKKVHWQNKNK